MPDETLVQSLKFQQELLCAYCKVLHYQEMALDKEDFSSAQTYSERSQQYMDMLRDYDRSMKEFAPLISRDPTLRSLHVSITTHRDTAREMTQRVLKKSLALKQDLTSRHTPLPGLRTLFAEKSLAQMVDFRY